MAYKSNNIVAIDDNRAGSFANVTVQNNGFLEVNSSDGFQGTVAGYTSGGYGPGDRRLIDKFPFATDTNATAVGALVGTGSYSGGGQSSSTHGYKASGFPRTNVNSAIEKFPFAADTNASFVGTLSINENSASGQSSSTSGYASGSGTAGHLPGDNIDKFPFATDSNATDIGSLTVGRGLSAGSSSSTHGYASGGYAPGDPAVIIHNVIDKFPFATDAGASDVGDLSQARRDPNGQSSTTHGYASGGSIPPANPIIQVNTIEKFPFATDTNATDIADLTQARFRGVGQSSTISGYSSGGTGTPSVTNVIDKFPFSSDTNATDVGDLTVARYSGSGQQD